MDNPKNSNKKLQHQRELLAWTQQQLADEIGTTVKRVSMWECGDCVPGRYYQKKLCRLFGKNAEELDFIGDPDSLDVSSRHQKLEAENGEPNRNQDIQIRIPHSIARSSSSIHITVSGYPPRASLPDEQSELPPLVDEQAPHTAYFMQDVASPSEAMPKLGNTPVDRRDFLRQVRHVAVGLMGAELLDRLNRALKKPSTIDERLLNYLDTHTNGYWQDRHGAVLASPDLLSYVIEHLQKVVKLLEETLLPAVRTHLCCTASGIAQLAGHLLLDMGEFASARNYHRVAITAAREGCNQALEAAAWGRMSFTWTYSGNSPEALKCIQEARHLATGNANTTVQAYLAAVEAEIQAIIGNPVSCLKALEIAERAEDQQYSRDEMYWLHFDRSRLIGYQGTCFKRLYNREDAQTHSFLNEAQRALAGALTLLDPARIQRRPALLIDIAGTYVQQPDVEGACEHAIQALSIMAQTKSQTVAKRLFTLRQELEPWKDTQYVKNLDQQMLQLITPRGYRGIA